MASLLLGLGCVLSYVLWSAGTPWVAYKFMLDQVRLVGSGLYDHL